MADSGRRKRIPITIRVNRNPRNTAAVVSRGQDVCCLICFTTIEGNTILCADPSCTAMICTDCADSLISFSHKEGIMPKCPSTTCSSHYLITGIRVLSPKTIELYSKACLKHVMKDKGDEVKKTLEQQLLVERLREERKKFIVESFPPAIAFVANIALVKRINSINRQNKQRITNTLNESHRICMNLICDGHLNNKLVCMKCRSKFCKKCEKLLRGDHKCNPEDIESINIIKEMIKCPKCKLPVQKSEGCNSMTCAHCDARFDYRTGNEGGHGSMNTKIHVDTKILLSVAYFDKIKDMDLMELLIEMESMEPKVVTDAAIIIAINLLYKSQNERLAARKLAWALDRYTRYTYAVRKYQQIMVDIEDYLRKNEITIELLTKYYELLS